MPDGPYLIIRARRHLDFDAKVVGFGMDEQAMPSKSKAQANMMRAAAHNPAFAKKAGVPQSVAQDYAQADAKRGTKRLPARKK